MNLLVFSANWYNRGDEAAIRAMLDELRLIYKDMHIKIHFNMDVDSFPISNIEILKPIERPSGRNFLKKYLYQLSVKTNGRIPHIGKNSKNLYDFIRAVKWADYAIYAPGGPCIGDFYGVREVLLDMIEIITRNNVPFSFFAPSVGPFSQDKERVKKLLNKAEVLCFREAISQRYYQELDPKKETKVTLDSAFQHPIDVEENYKQLNKDVELKDFLESNNRIIGITVTDLKWHRSYKDTDISETIREAFLPFVKWLEDQGFAVLFIPQLFGKSDDKEYMRSYVGKNSYVMSDQQDCYFQQYIVSRLYAVVGMRYHSNIFSAKMGVPFISVAYEQKMQGFMNKAGLQKYCVNVKELTEDKLKKVFLELLSSYDDYKKFLGSKKDEFRLLSFETTKLIAESINRSLER